MGALIGILLMLFLMLFVILVDWKLQQIVKELRAIHKDIIKK